MTETALPMSTLRLVAVESVFNTIQGEGALVGTPSTFIRLHGCNQECAWCDTKDSWREGSTYETLTTAQVVERLREVGCYHHVVITGGNPMLQAEGLDDLLSDAFFRGRHVTIETNAYAVSSALTGSGGRYRPLFKPHLRGFLWSLSPKLHDWDRVTAREYLKRPMTHLSTAERVQIKVVVQTPEDLDLAGIMFSDLTLFHPGHMYLIPWVTFVVQPEYSKMRSLMKSPEFTRGLKRLTESHDIRVIPQVHKGMGLL